MNPCIVETNREVLEVYTSLVQLWGCCLDILALWKDHQDHLESWFSEISQPQVESYQVPRSRPERGHPQLLISKDQLYLRGLNFSWTQISKLLGVSRMTIWRRRRDLHIVEFSHHRSASTNELHELLRQICHEMSNMGEVLVLGRLHSLGYTVTRKRVRDAIHATDPLNTALQWRGILTTPHPYSVPAPNSLWHIRT